MEKTKERVFAFIKLEFDSALIRGCKQSDIISIIITNGVPTQ
ncbi:hypothetical protein ACFQ3W_06620 [Paenibacillus puldeungensis]|uniref:Uncharacterized protein n=1 Tax=Paenibacillus puldeungensis TaxID=696536 RepID=A0ABW3RV25_9BACL